MLSLKYYRPIFFLPYVLLFAGVVIYFGFVADYISFYQEKLSLFVFSGDYFLDNIKGPGDLLVYLGKFLTTFFHSPLPGGIIIASLLCITGLTISSIHRNLTGETILTAPILASLYLYFLQTDYHFLLFNSLGLFLQLMIFRILMRRLNGWLPLVILPVWYFITGGFSLLFCMMYSLFILAWSFKRNWYKLLIFWIYFILILYISKEFIFFRSLQSLVSYPLSKAGTGSGFIFFLILAGLLSFTPAISRFTINIQIPLKIPGTLKRVSGWVLIAGTMVIITLLRYDKKDEQYFTVEKLFYQGRYNAVTDYAARNPSLNKLTIFLNNIALSETGRLNDKLFQSRQDPEGQTLFLKWEMLGEVLRNGGYFYYTTGMINEALRWAYENMVMDGLTPEGLKMLIKTELINGNYAVASKYISILKKTVFYRAEAGRYERFLFNDEAVESDPDLGLRRKTKITHDFFTLTGDPYANIGMVLAGDSLNRRAFEYKIAYQLIRKDHKGIAESLSRLPMYGFTKIPVHLEEAVVVYNKIYSGEADLTVSLPISNNTNARFTRFMQTLKAYGNNPKIAEPYLRKDFGDTFWYYVFYR